MKRHLLSFLTLGIAVLAASALPPRQSGHLKQVNTAGHAATARKAAAPSAAPTAAPAAVQTEAPEKFYEVPFTHTLGKATAQKPNTDLYKDFDVNADGKGFKVGGFSTYTAILGPDKTKAEANDDWMISPAVHLLAGKSYTAKYKEGVNTPDGVKEGRLSFHIGSSQTVEGMEKVLIEEYGITVKEQEKEVEFTVDADGYYHFGWHCTTTAAKTAISKLYDFTVEDTKAKIDPPAAGTLAYTLAPKGELKASVTYTAPVLTVSGEKLAEIQRVEIKTNWVVTNTFTDITPGESRTFEVELYNSGNNKIEATAYVADTPGEIVTADKIYAGPDNPKPLTGLKLALSDDYKHVTLSWDPVEATGENGGYVDTEKAVYYIFDAFGSYYDPAIATTEQTSITLDYSDFVGQDFVAYQVTAGIDETYYSLATTSDIAVIGTPESLPFTESFPGAYYEQAWAIDPETSSTVLVGTFYDNELQTNMDDEEAEPEYLNSHDGDNGFFFIMPMNKDDVYGLFSTKIDISGADRPVLEFWHQGMGSIIDVMIAADGGSFNTVKSIDLKATPTEDWTLCRVPLDDFKTARYIQMELRLRAVHNDETTTWSVPIDNIRIRELADVDVRLVSISSPDDVRAGEDVKVEANIENRGDKTADISAVLLKNGQSTGEPTTCSVAPNSFGTASFTLPTSLFDEETNTLRVEISAQGDAHTADNAAETKLNVVMPKFPAATDLEASAKEQNVELSWTAPAYEELLKPVDTVEDFESPDYPALTIADFGGWILYDGDKLRTYTFLKDTDNPYRTMPMSFQLYDPVKAGVPSDYLIDCDPHSGSTMLVAWSAQEKQNDNWLISPELSGNAQTVSFFARSFTSQFPESFEVLYSTGSTKLPDFVKIDNVGNYPADDNVAETWTEYTADLPEGAKRFAIRHTAVDSYALYVDDIKFQTASPMPSDLALSGYNIYRNGVKVNEAPVDDTVFTDSPAETGTYAYRVTAVYNHGESRPCAAAEVTVEVSGVTAAATSAVAISTEGSEIVITGAQGLPVAVWSVDGRCIYSSAAAGAAVRVSASEGFYIVTAGNVTAKVAI